MSGESEVGSDQSFAETVALRQFLESQPPHQKSKLTKLAKWDQGRWLIDLPSIRIHCDSKVCADLMFFDPVSREFVLNVGESQLAFLRYSCRHCNRTDRIYALSITLQDGQTGEAMKIGELPPFGPHIPTRMFSLLGEDQELFHKGVRAESQGMGIGAFAYYRRVVENQKNRLIDEIIKVSKRLDAPPEIVAKLEEARLETRFQSAVKIVKDGIPEILRINGHNPLTLLHDALSDGLHDQSDEECLVRAQAIRYVLAEVSERIVQALKEHVELGQAVSKLLQIQSAKGKPVAGKPDSVKELPTAPGPPNPAR